MQITPEGMVIVQVNKLANTQEIKKRLKEILEILMANEVTKPLTPQKLKAILLALGPQFVELGRILAEHNDILPKDYYDELYSSTPNKSSINYDRIEGIIENEYGASMDDVFTDFSKNPTYQSPLFQCHKAVLKDGPQVIVKIQDPKLKNYISEDTDLIKKALEVLRIGPSPSDTIDLNMIFDELWNIAQKELNFFVEADNATRFYKLNSGEKNIIAPKVNNKYNTSNILVMEYIPGITLGNNEELIANGYQLSEISKILSENYVKQIFTDGFFQAYPNPQNILFYKSNLAWTNFTLMSELSSYDLEALKNIIKAISSKDVDQISNIIMSINTNDISKNLDNLKIELSQILTSPSILNYKSQSLPVTNIIRAIVALLNKLDIYLPESYSHLLSGLISIENIIERLDFNTKLIDAIKNTVFPVSQEPISKQEEKVPNNYNDIITEITNKQNKNENIINSLLPKENTNEELNKPDHNLNIPLIEDPLKLESLKKANLENSQQKSNSEDNIVDHNKDLEQAIKESLERSKKLEQDVKAVDANSEEHSSPVHIVKKSEHDNSSSNNTKLEFKFKMDDLSIKSINKLTNNVIICLISICFFIGSCFVLSLDKPIFTIYGLPAIAVLFFAISVISIIWLIIRILRK